MRHRLDPTRAFALLLGAGLLCLAPVAGAFAQGSSSNQLRDMALEEMRKATQKKYQYSGGDGRTCSAAVKVTNARDTLEAISGAHQWIRERGGVVTGQALSRSAGKAFDIYSVKPRPGEGDTVCFDITATFGK